MKFVSSYLAFISTTIVWSLLFSLCFSIAGSIAFAEPLPGTTCPPGFACFLSEPRDGACRHPAIVLDQQTKSTRYEGNRFSRAYEKACIAKASSLVTRRGAELHLKLANGATKSYTDRQATCENGPYTGCKKYVLYDFFPEHGLFLIHVGYNESQAWYLVNKVDGEEQEIIAPPRYSPNKKWLASVYATDGGDDGNNGIDIFPADLNPARSGFHYRPKDYEQWEFVGWNGDDRLLLEVTARVGDNPEQVTWPAEAVHANGQWQLKKGPLPSPRP